MKNYSDRIQFQHSDLRANVVQGFTAVSVSESERIKVQVGKVWIKLLEGMHLKETLKELEEPCKELKWEGTN